MADWWEKDTIVQEPKPEENWWEKDDLISTTETVQPQIEQEPKISPVDRFANLSPEAKKLYRKYAAPALEEVTSKKEGLLNRLGKQLYNAVIARPGHELAKSDVTEEEHLAVQIQKERIKKRKKEGVKFTENWLNDEYEDIIFQLRQNPKARESDDLKEYPKFFKKIDKNELAIAVSEAEGLKDTAVDITAGITGFVAQIAILKKAFPTAPPAVIWEVQNQVNGGTPGMGAVTYGAFATPGKITAGLNPASKIGKALKITGTTALESASLAGVTALEQKLDSGEIDWKEVAISAGIPIALKTPALIKAGLKAKNPKIMKAVSQVQARTAERPQGKTLGATKKGVPIRLEETRTRSEIEGFRDLIKKGKEAEAGKKMHDYLTKLATEKRIAMSKIKEETGKLSKAKSKKEINLRKTNIKNFMQELQDTKTKESFYKSQVKTETPKIEKTVAEPVVEDTTKQLVDWAKTAKKLRKTEVEPAIRKLHGRGAIRGTKILISEMKKGTPFREAQEKSKAGLKGSANIPDVHPPPLTDTQWRGLENKLEQLYPKENVQVYYKRLNTEEALTKLRTGKIPTNAEFGYLEPLFGRDTTVKLAEGLISKKTYGLLDIPEIIKSGAKSPFAYDPQALRGFTGVSARHPIIYAKTGIKNILSYSGKYANKVNRAVESSPGFELSKKYLPYAPMTPYGVEGKLQQYGAFTDFMLSRKNRIAKTIGKALRATERAANAGTNYGLKKLWDESEKELARILEKKSMTPKQINKWRQNRADVIAANTKTLYAKTPKGKQVERLASWVAFSPAYTRARPTTMWDMFAKSGSRRYAAELVVSNITKLTAISSLIGYAAHKRRADNPTEEPPFDSSGNPTDSLWGKVRHRNDVYDLSLGEASWYRTLSRLCISGYAYAKKLQGERVTEVAGKKVQPAGQVMWDYLQTRETAIIGVMRSLFTGKDFWGDDITIPETLIKSVTPEGLVAVYESGASEGLWANILEQDISESSKQLFKSLPPGLAAAGTIGTSSYPVSAASTRKKFKDIIAQQEYGKRWDDLTQIQQIKLTSKHKQQFDSLNERVKQERVEKPFIPENIIEEEKKAGDRIRKNLTKENQVKVEGISVNISRSPDKFYLNDKRYQRYEELVTENLNKFLEKVKLREGISDKLRRKIIEKIITRSKKTAFTQLRREMK